MISVTDGFKNAIKGITRRIAVEITSVSDEMVASLSDDISHDGTDIVSVDIESSGLYFNAVTRAATIVLWGTSYSYIDEWVSISLIALSQDGSSEVGRCNLGRFQVYEQSVDLDSNKTTLKAYDPIGVMGTTEYTSGELTFPCTVQSLVEQVAQRFNLTIETNLTTLPNYNYQITEDLYANINGTTYRDILSEVAGATATIVRASGGKLYLVPPPSTTYDDSWTYANLQKIKYLQPYGPINSVVLARTPAEDNIALSDDESVEENGLTELKLANNEILDDSRETLISPILNAVDGFNYYPFEATTTGMGYYECGDYIKVTDDANNSYNLVISYSKLTLDGGVKEALKGEALEETSTDYALAGGITKTIYNTEIKVDKQNQYIESVVSEQQIINGETSENFTQVMQELDNLTVTVQNSGGANLVKNSVGYATNSDGTLESWTQVGAVSSATSPESVRAGAVSGNAISLGAEASIMQRIAINADSEDGYTLTFRAKKGVTGSATVSLTNEVDDFSIELPDQEDAAWGQYSITDIHPTQSYLDLTVEVDDNIVDFAITDLMFASGSKTTWTQAQGEVLSTNVQMTENGVKVKSSVYEGDYTEMTPLGFTGYSSASGSSKAVFSLNRETTVMQKAEVADGITIPPVKIVPITEGSKKGLAFVPSDI